MDKNNNQHTFVWEEGKGEENEIALSIKAAELAEEISDFQYPPA